MQRLQLPSTLKNNQPPQLHVEADPSPQEMDPANLHPILQMAKEIGLNGARWLAPLVCWQTSDTCHMLSHSQYNLGEVWANKNLHARLLKTKIHRRCD